MEQHHKEQKTQLDRTSLQTTKRHTGEKSTGGGSQTNTQETRKTTRQLAQLCQERSAEHHQPASRLTRNTQTPR